MSSLNYLELCRLCLVKDRVHIGIFEGEGEVRQIFLKIAACLPVKVRKDDRLPKQICDDCLQKVELLYQFWNQTANAEKQLLEWLGETVDDKTVETNVKHEHMEQDAGSELANSLSRVEAVLAEAREHESSDNDHFGDDSHKPETDSDDEPLSSLEPTQFINVNLNGSQSTTAQTQEEFLAPSAPSTSKSNVPAAVAQAAGSGCNKENEGEIDEITCSICGVSIPVERLEEHNTLAHPEDSLQICNVCNKVFCNRDDLLIHMRSHPKPPKVKKGHKSPGEPTQTEWQCNECERVYPTKQQLKSHMKVHKHEPYSLDCKICNKVFKTTHYAREHLKVHTGERPFKCHLCNRSFMQKQHLISHKKRQHFKDHAFKCDQCEKGFHSKTELQVHKNWHNGERPHMCDVCGKSYPSKSNMMGHKRTHHPRPDGTLKRFPCEICNRPFMTKRSLLNHSRSHTGESGHFGCQICGKALSSRQSLKAHHMIHTGEKPISCQYCFKSFTTTKYLRTHLKAHAAEKPFKCPECNMGFSQRSMLQAHLKIHRDVNLKCEECGLGFSNSSLLANHKLSHQQHIIIHHTTEPAKSDQQLLVHQRTQTEPTMIHRIITQPEQPMIVTHQRFQGEPTMMVAQTEQQTSMLVSHQRVQTETLADQSTYQCHLWSPLRKLY